MQKEKFATAQKSLKDIIFMKNVPDEFNSEKAKRLKTVHKVSPQLSYRTCCWILDITFAWVQWLVI
jgi:hypothetical protein